MDRGSTPVTGSLSVAVSVIHHPENRNFRDSTKVHQNLLARLACWKRNAPPDLNHAFGFKCTGKKRFYRSPTRPYPPGQCPKRLNPHIAWVAVLAGALTRVRINFLVPLEADHLLRGEHFQSLRQGVHILHLEEAGKGPTCFICRPHRRRILRGWKRVRVRERQRVADKRHGWDRRARMPNTMRPL